MADRERKHIEFEKGYDDVVLQIEGIPHKKEGKVS
jgi:hypothetical protein